MRLLAADILLRVLLRVSDTAQTRSRAYVFRQTKPCWQVCIPWLLSVFGWSRTTFIDEMRSFHPFPVFDAYHRRRRISDSPTKLLCSQACSHWRIRWMRSCRSSRRRRICEPQTSKMLSAPFRQTNGLGSSWCALMESWMGFFRVTTLVFAPHVIHFSLNR